MNVSREKKIQEAIDRMKALDIYGEIIESFREDGKVSLSEPPFGAFYWLEGEDLERINKFEEEYNAVVYVAIRAFTEIGKMDAYLYVSDHEEEWPSDREDIANKEVMSYVYNHDMPDCSEFGYIGLERTVAAGLKRIW